MKVRNQLATLAMECDSAAAIEGSKLTGVERSALRQRLRDDVAWIDKKLALELF